MTQTQMGEFTVNPPASGGVIRRSVDRAALIAPAQTGASVSPSVVGAPYASAADVANDFDGTSTPSLLTAGARAAFRSGARKIIAATFGSEDHASELIEDSDTSALAQGTLANTPISAVSAVTVDGTAMDTITFTTGDPFAATPAADEAIVNPSTGRIKVGTASGGAAAGILVSYSQYDTADLFANLAKQPFRIITVAGTPLTEQTFGLYSALADYAAEDNKQVSYALDSGVTPADSEDLVAAFRGKHIVPITAHYTGDLSSAWAALVASRPAWATRKDQSAPAGATYTDTYIRREFGDDRDPSADTWHGMGVNAVYRDPGGSFRTSSDRAATGYTDAYRWMSTYAVERLIQLDAEDDIRASRQTSDTGMPFNDGGLAGLESTIRGSVSRNALRGAITRLVDVVMPLKEDLSESDISARAVTDAQVTFEHAGQIHTVFVSLNSTL